MIQFSAFEKSYNDRLIVKADMELPESFYWLKGGNGSGKSTLLRSIAGINPYKGTISVGGLNIRKQRVAYRMSVSYAEAEPLYPDFLTGEDMISFYVDVRKADKQQVADLKEQLGVGTYAHSKIGTYSSGMLKKLSLMLAFIGQPKLIMLDEPFITIDTGGLDQLNKLINQSCQDGTRVLITSHQDVHFSGGLSPALLAIHNSELIAKSI